MSWLPEITNDSEGVKTSSAADVMVVTEDAMLSNETKIVSPVGINPDSNKSLGTIGDTDTITEFLSRPVYVATTSFGNIPRNTTLFSNSIDSLISSCTAWTNKMSGFNAIEGTFEFIIQIKSSPMAQGALLFNYDPNPNATGTTRTTLIARSQLPSVIMDINSDSEVIFQIPLNVPTGRYMIGGSGLGERWGTFNCFCLSPYATGQSGASSASVTVWMRIMDSNPSYRIAPQARGAPGTKSRVRRTKGPVHPTEQEKGPVSVTLSAISTMAGTLSSIPTLTPIAGPVSWFTNALAGVATAFGWSKPLNDNFGTRMIAGQHAGMINSNGHDNSLPLSLAADNHIRVVSAFGGTTQDEMSINYIKRHWSYFNYFNMSTNDLSGSLAYAAELGPQYFKTTDNVFNTVPYAALTPIAYLSTLYRYWRGSIELKFKFIKTPFHAGRVLIGLVPRSSANMSPVNANYLHKTYVDLEVTDEICINFPYLYMDEYKNCADGPAAYNSLIQVVNVNPLVCPENVSSSIQVLVSVRGGEDLEFQMPSASLSYPIVAQGRVPGEDLQDVCVPLSNTVGVQSVSDASQYCIGEMSTSLLQLLKRYNRIQNVFLEPLSKLSVYPFASWGAAVNNSALVPPLYGRDCFSSIASLYLYQRGGVRLRISNNIANGTCAVTYRQANANRPYTVVTTTGIATGFPGGETDILASAKWNVPVSIHSMKDGGFSVQCPYYNRWRVSYNTVGGPINYSGNYFGPAYLACFQVIGDSGSSILFRAVADDFQFMYFLGVPDMIINSTSATP